MDIGHWTLDMWYRTEHEHGMAWDGVGGATACAVLLLCFVSTLTMKMRVEGIVCVGSRTLETWYLALKGDGGRGGI